MDKKRVIAVVTRAAKLYHENLEDQKVMFIYGIPAIINREIESESNRIDGLNYYEATFLRANFLHLTGIIINKQSVSSAIHFYSKCLDGRLSEKDIYLAHNGSTVQKMEVIESMMHIKRNASMIGDFSGLGMKLYSEKIAGNTFACMGFVEDRYSSLHVPNTLLKKDIRDVSSKPQQKIYAVLSKQYSDDNYSIIEKCDSRIDLSRVAFLKEMF